MNFSAFLRTQLQPLCVSFFLRASAPWRESTYQFHCRGDNPLLITLKLLFFFAFAFLCLSTALRQKKSTKLTLPNLIYQSYGSVLVHEGKLVLAERSES
jgi:hypothetical protein